MEAIRAFVGHSFIEEDAVVIGVFREFFNQLSKTHSFMWENAQPAEPKALAEKVLALMEGKNTFIAICTRRERVINDSNLRPSLLRPAWMLGKRENFHWKTSDWVIQEIGLAKGRGLNLIILLEEGVRSPGGLQGDLEYISFDRKHPQESFVKILQMVGALNPKVSLPAITSETPSGEPKRAERDKEEDLANPAVDWDRSTYEKALFFALHDGEDERAKKVSAAYLSTPEGAKAPNKLSWELLEEYFRVRLSKNGSLQKLRQLVGEQPLDAKAHFYLALALRSFDETEEAAREFDAASTLAKNDTERLDLKLRASIDYGRAKLNLEQNAALNAAREIVSKNPSEEAQLLQALKDLATDTDDKIRVIGTLERLLELHPDDTDNRFSLAFQYGEMEFNDLSLLHYLRIPTDQREPGTWNNIGAASANAGLPAKAVEAYRKAEGMKETLAMSNLADIYSTAGFIGEAKNLCEAALQIPGYNKKVPSSLARAQGVLDAEQEKQNELLTSAGPRTAFFRSFGRSLARLNLTSLAEVWVGPNGELRISLTSDEFAATGSYEVPASGLASFGLLESQNKPTRYTISYRGTISGRTIHGSVSRSREQTTPAIGLGALLFNAEDAKFIMMVHDGEQQIDVMENPESASARIYQLKRKS